MRNRLCLWCAALDIAVTVALCGIAAAAAWVHTRDAALAQFDAWARAAGCLERHTGYDGRPVEVWTCAPVPTWRAQMVEVE